MEIDLKEEKGCEVSINNVTRFHSLFYSVGVNPKDYSSMAACAAAIYVGCSVRCENALNIR